MRLVVFMVYSLIQLALASAAFP